MGGSSLSASVFVYCFLFTRLIYLITYLEDRIKERKWRNHCKGQGLGLHSGLPPECGSPSTWLSSCTFPATSAGPGLEVERLVFEPAFKRDVGIRGGGFTRCTKLPTLVFLSNKPISRILKLIFYFYIIFGNIIKGWKDCMCVNMYVCVFPF